MNTKAKSNSVITHDVDTLKSIVTFNVLGVGSLSIDFVNVSQENKHQAMIHGFIQRISDAAAISRDTETGQPATAQEKFDAMKKLVGHYESGTSEWSRVAAAGEGKSGGLLLQALIALSPSKTREELVTWMKGKTKAQLSALRAEPRIAAEIARIRPVSLEVDTDALLSELK